MSKFLTNTLLLLSLVMIFTVKFITPVFTLNVQAFGAQNITETVDDLRKTTPKVDPIEPNSPFKNPDDYNWVDEFGVPCNPLSVKPAKVSKALSPWDYLVAFVTPIGVHAAANPGAGCFAVPKFKLNGRDSHWDEKHVGKSDQYLQNRATRVADNVATSFKDQQQMEDLLTDFLKTDEGKDLLKTAISGKNAYIKGLDIPPSGYGWAYDPVTGNYTKVENMTKAFIRFKADGSGGAYLETFYPEP